MRRTLFRKYAFHLAGLVSALLVVSGGVAGYFSYREAVAALEQVQRAEVRFAAAEIAIYMGRAQDALRSTVTKFGAAREVALDELRLELVAVFRHHPEISELRWIASDGSERFFVSRFGPNVTTDHNWSPEPLFQRARRDGSYAGPVYFRKETEPYVVMAAAHQTGGSVLAAEVDLKHVWDVLSQLRLSSRSTAYVVDANGRLVSHPDMALVLGNTDLASLPQVQQILSTGTQRTVLTREAHDIHGVRVLSTAAPIENLGWTVFAEQPLDQAFEPVYASIARSVALVILGLVAAIVASLVLARRMARPIQEIKTRAQQLAGGDFAHRIDVRTGDEIEALASQFNRMAARLEETHRLQERRIAERTHDLAVANEAKTRFLAAATHDLRQPIHALSLFVGQLRTLDLPADGNDLLHKTERSLDALNELLEALLDLSKLDVGAIAPQPRSFPLHDLLGRLAQQFAPTAEAKGLAISCVPTSLWVCSDPVLLERIMLNLLSNAVRYTVQGRILIGCLRRGTHVQVVVADTGVGIDRAELPRIFDEFYRVDVHRGMGTGLGLGLAIVKRLARLLDHTLEIESTVGKGTLVRLLVPRASPTHPATLLTTRTDDSLRGAPVLVIDDEPASREAMQGLLSRWGCKTLTAASGDEAMACLREEAISVVLCDLSLGASESGIDVVARLRAECGPDVAFAFVTAESSPERIAIARATGHPVVFKPTSPAKLRALVEHLLAARPRAIAGADHDAHSPQSIN